MNIKNRNMAMMEVLIKSFSERMDCDYMRISKNFNVVWCVVINEHKTKNITCLDVQRLSLELERVFGFRELALTPTALFIMANY